MMLAYTLLAVCLGALCAHAAPAERTTQKPNVLNGIGNVVAGALPQAFQSALLDIEQDIKHDALDAHQLASAYFAVMTDATTSARAPPTAIASVSSSVAKQFKSHPTSLAEPAVGLLLDGVKLQGNIGVVDQSKGITNQFHNVNTRRPKYKIFPRRSNADAPYSVSEAQLRAAIYIPPGFTYGQKPPVILSPGTGSTGGDTFAGNFIPTLTGKPYADPVWLNIPGYLLGDAQVNAEYVAYAINYIASISTPKYRQKMGIITWSQGGLNAQWAFKYWPSTRSHVSNFIAISPDFRGTVQAEILCPGFPKLPCDPSVLQQLYNSTFIATLRENNGDSAYVPTTTVYSSVFDEIVQPQTGSAASAHLYDTRGVGVTNNEVQAICPGRPAGSFFTHEGVLYNAIAHALAIDALTHGGPGKISRINLAKLCDYYAAPGLSVEDVLSTEATIPQALINLLFYFPKYQNEGAIKIKPYAHRKRQ